MDFAASMARVIPGTFVPDIGGSDKPSVTAIPAGGEAQGAPSFKDTVKDMLADVNDKITTSDQNTRDYASGKTSDLQKVVTSVEEANLALQFTMAMRTKLLEAYSEISRMQV
ncbi:MAG: flagellar hook-basal body complex protein FliE [Candidatus Velthaea sp.]